MLWRKLSDLLVEAMAGVQAHFEGRARLHEHVLRSGESGIVTGSGVSFGN